MSQHGPGDTRLPRRSFLALPGAAAIACGTRSGSPELATQVQDGRTPRKGWPVLVGSANALPGMRDHYASLEAGGDPLDVALEVVKVVEANPRDHSVGLGGLPNEDGVVQLDAAVMHGPTHNSGAVAAIEDILHPCEVARLVMERTDHCLIVGRGAYDFARAHGHPHTELLTDDARRIWLKWRETMSDRDDRLPPPPADDVREGWVEPERERSDRPDDEYADELAALMAGKRPTGTIHCSALSVDGEVACTTTTSGLAYKIPGRVGDSPIVGAGLYCDAEAGSAGATGRGEAAVLSNGSFAIVELMRGGAAPVDAGLEVLRRITRQVQRASKWQPALLGEGGVPAFGLHFYVLGLDGTWAGVTMKGSGEFAVADPDHGARHEELVPLHR